MSWCSQDLATLPGPGRLSAHKQQPVLPRRFARRCQAALAQRNPGRADDVRSTIGFHMFNNGLWWFSHTWLIYMVSIIVLPNILLDQLYLGSFLFDLIGWLAWWVGHGWHGWHSSIEVKSEAKLVPKVATLTHRTADSCVCVFLDVTI